MDPKSSHGLKRGPTGSQRDAKGGQRKRVQRESKGAPKEPKGSPKGGQGSPKRPKRGAKRAKTRPKGPQREPKGAQNECKMRPKTIYFEFVCFLRILRITAVKPMIPKVGGSIFGAKIDRKTIKNKHTMRNRPVTRKMEPKRHRKSKKGAQKQRHGAQIVPKNQKRSPKASLKIH